MPVTSLDSAVLGMACGTPAPATEESRNAALFKAGVLQSAIFSSAACSIIATDEQGIIRLFNIGAERMLGYAAADLINKSTPAHISDPLEVLARAVVLNRDLAAPISPGFEALVFNAARGVEDVYELTYIRKDGSRLPAIVAVTALRDAGEKIIGYLLISTDNSVRTEVNISDPTERKQAEAEIFKAKSVREKASLANAEFLSGMSHELRTSLNAILGFAQLMESDAPPPTPSQKEGIAKIEQAGWYLLELVNEILDLAMIESGRLAWSLEPMSLAEVMLECQAAIEPQAEKSGIRMTYPEIGGDCFIKADRTRVKQVLVNLISNAIKYNQGGGSVVVECAISPQRVRVSVTDTGAGMTPEKLAQLFRPFSRVGQDTSAVAGAGIGLVVTKRVVELMGGAIGVRSHVGKGSVFWVELVAATAPRLAVEDADAKLVIVAPAKVRRGAASRTLLYVEDNPANLQLVEQIIARRPDMRLLSARSGPLGIELARSARPDVILMDINLPGMSGIKAMQILHADTATAHIPIVALSANAIPRDIERGLEAGFFRYLTKPIKVTEFMDTLDVALKHAEHDVGQSA